MKTKFTFKAAFFQLRVLVGFALCSAGLFLALAGLSKSVTGTIATTGRANPVPLINQPLVPDAVAPRGPDFTLTVNGTGFVSGSVVSWNGSARTTTFVSPSQLTANIPSTDIAAGGFAAVTVNNPRPGGGTSNVAFFEVATPTSSLTMAVSDYAANNGPLWVGTDDFNADGNLDLAVVTFIDDTVAILLGNGTGTFQPSVPYATGTNPVAATIADFNRDGHPDLAVANASGNSVSILLGNGDGTFQAKVDYSTGNEPLWVVAGDFNEDGKIDLAVTNGSDNTVSILLGKGDGTFQPEVPYATGDRPFPVTTGDFNGDGHLDLAVGDQLGNDISILLGKGDGTFNPLTSYAAGLQIYGVTTGDFNGDGRLDLATANVSGATVSVLLGNGDGSFQTEVEYPTLIAPFSLITADFNADGKLDLAVGDGGDAASSASILLGNGDGTFQTHVDYATGQLESDSVVAGDFNKDGKMDLAAANLVSNTVSVLLQNSIAFSKPSLDFRPELIGTSSVPQRVRLTNIGDLAVTISSIAVTGTDASDFSETNTCGSRLKAGKSCTISVTFSPTQPAVRTAAVTVTYGAASSQDSVALSGTGIASGRNATLSPTSMSFKYFEIGGHCFAPQPQTATLTNYGTEALSITSITTTNTDFSQTNTCGPSLGPGKSCDITVSFAKSFNGTDTGELEVFDNASGGLQTVALTGVRDCFQ